MSTEAFYDDSCSRMRDQNEKLDQILWCREFILFVIFRIVNPKNYFRMRHTKFLYFFPLFFLHFQSACLQKIIFFSFLQSFFFFFLFGSLSFHFYFFDDWRSLFLVNLFECTAGRIIWPNGGIHFFLNYFLGRMMATIFEVDEEKYSFCGACFRSASILISFAIFTLLTV